GRTAVSALVINDTPVFWQYVQKESPLSVAVLADNAGRELIPDLMLIDMLLAEGLAATVRLHVKPYPYFVSDAVAADVSAAIDRMHDGPPAARGAPGRLGAAAADDRFTVTAAEIFAAPVPYRDDTPELSRRLGGIDLTILKGDLNYRRLVGDQHWP